MSHLKGQKLHKNQIKISAKKEILKDLKQGKKNFEKKFSKEIKGGCLVALHKMEIFNFKIKKEQKHLNFLEKK